MAKSPLGRLAMRQEGEYWNAYFAAPGTMDGAIRLGSIRLSTVTNNPNRKAAFMDMMVGIAVEDIEKITSERPVRWIVEVAPERERSGNA